MTTNDSKRICAHKENQCLEAHQEEKLLTAHTDDALAAAQPVEDPIFTNSRKGNVGGAMKWGMAIMLALAVASAIAVIIGLNHHRSSPSDTPATAFATPGGNFILKGSYAPQFDRSASLFTVNAPDNQSQQSKPSSTATAVSADGRATILAISDPTTRMIYLFELDESDIPENATLNEFAKRISDEGKDVSIVAYTDPTGSATHNRDLSNKRARSLGNYLTAHGVNPTHVKVSGKGATDAFGSNKLDRRAELHF